MSDPNLILQNLHFITANLGMEAKDGKAVRQIVTLCSYGISEGSLEGETCIGLNWWDALLYL